MTMELAIAQGWHGEAWGKLPEEEQQHSLRRAAAALTSLATFNCGGLLEVSGYSFDFSRKTAWRTSDSLPCNLTGKEFELAYYLASRAGICCGYKEILRSVWGLSYIEYRHYLTVCLHNLRPKLRDILIITRNGVGLEWKNKS